jgi:DNA-nicking Smr family endonuclease
MTDNHDDPNEDGTLEDATEFEITDVLDLHTFHPSEVKDLVRDYLDLAWEKGLRKLRIIHGKGVGVQRQTVRKILERDPRVLAYGDPPGFSGGWGATSVELGEGDAES